MLGLDANVSRFHFECAQLDDGAFQVASFRGVEEISRLFRFDLDLVSRDPNIAFDDVVNQPATFTLMRGQDPSPVSGLVTHLEQAGRSGENYRYRAVLAPRLWMLSLTYKSSVFKEMKVDEIVTDVLQEAGFDAGVDFRFQVSEPYPPRDYCVQYRETDFNFISRLMEEEGIFYYFEHDGQKDVMVIGDSQKALEAMPGASILPYDERAGLTRDRETVHDVTYREQVVTGNVVLSDYNYRTPDVTLRSEHVVDGRLPGTYSEFGDHFRDTGQGDQRAMVRSQEIASHRRELRGKSDCAGLRSGYLFTLEEHYRADLDQDYLITRVEHEGSQGRAMAAVGPSEQGDGAGGDPRYENGFTAIPADVPFRPARVTPKPEVPGVISAKVESSGEDGKYAYIDDQGRYHVRMHLDLDNRYGKGNATHPIRMSQPYSGPNYGIHFPNHENTEALLAFENGDIDRPVALGTVPNPNNKAPAVSTNRMQNVIRTAAGNELVMDDTEKETQVLLKSADAHRLLLDDKGDCIIIETTNKHKATFDDKNEKIEVKTKDGHLVLMDDKNKKVTVQSKDGHRISINDKDKLMTMVDEKGNNLFQIDIGNDQITIESKKGSIELLAPKGAIDLKAKTVNVESTADTNITADGNIKAEAAADFDTKAGANYSAEAGSEYKQKGMNVKSEASMQHNIKGMQVKSEGSAKNDMQGALVSVKASGINQIQGSLVKIN